jgi:undecaprenyl-diphosphatase
VKINIRLASREKYVEKSSLPPQVDVNIVGKTPRLHPGLTPDVDDAGVRTPIAKSALNVIARHDGALFDFICARRNAHLDRFMIRVTRSGGLATYLVLAVAGWVVGGEAGRLLLAAASAAGLAAAIGYLPKRLVARPRPTLGSASRHALLKHPDAWSFPSSHTATAFAAAITLGAALGPVALATLLLWAAAVGISRVYVGAHYPLDVLMGAVLGTSVALTLAGFRDDTAAFLLTTMSGSF